MSKPVRIREFVAVPIAVLAEAEKRPFANMVEVLLSEALTERGGESVPTSEAHVTMSSPPRSVSADVAATIPGVHLLRPHFRRDRPAVQCEARIVEGEVCSVCGAVG